MNDGGGFGRGGGGVTVPDLLTPVRAALAYRYAIERRIGGGGMATVYLAEDLERRGKVAVKVFRPELAAALGTERFLREIQIASRLQHPRILPVYDSGERQGILFYAMPYVDGESLRDRLTRERQLAMPEALHVTCEVADALHYAHSQGVIHRDVKPANILLEAGHAMVADFGIALAMTTAGERLTEQGLSLGTPEYMSPEQASGDQVDARSDLYSLACVLYEILVGQPPFVGANGQAVMARHVVDPVPPITTVRPNVPANVARAVGQALAKVPSDRFATLQEFVEALRSTADPVPARPSSIAVLPFANMSADPENEYLSDGLSEEIINALTKVEGFRVAARTSSFAYKGINEDIRVIGERLNVGAVLEGSVRKAGNHLRITAQLIDVASGYHLWSERFDREMQDVFMIQDEIAENVAYSLRMVLSEDQKRAIQEVRTRDVVAYEYYLRGRQYFRQFRHKGLEYAREMFKRAIALDSAYALAYTGLADSCSFLYMYFASGEDDLVQAVEASEMALTLAPELPIAHASQGLAFMLRRRYAEAEEAFETAIRLDPNLFEGHYFYARACMQQGKFAQAAQLFAQACRVREDYQARLLAAQAYAALHQTKRAEAGYRAAIRVIERHLEVNPGDARALTLGSGCHARIGQEQEALEWAERALAIDREDAVVLYAIACSYATLERADQALDMLEAAVQAGFSWKDWIENDPDFDPLRDHSRYQAILSQL
jgi:serine/threonine protein kinase/tetratricopeptide (TPR) repeat protein